MPCKVVRLSTKDLKNKAQMDLPKEGIIFLGFEASITALDKDVVRASSHQGPRVSTLSEQDCTRKPVGLLVNGIQPGATELARIICLSPWLSIVLEVLAGQYVNPWDTWIYPFKHILVYEKQIRKLVDLLSEVGLEEFQAKELPSMLRRIFRLIPLDLVPTRNEHDYSDFNFENILPFWSKSLRGHFEKAKRSLTRSWEKPCSVEERDKKRIGSSPPFSPQTNENADRKNQNRRETADPAEHKQSNLACTCLREAKDHLQLLVAVIDEYMAPLLTLRDSISERSLKKIQFRDLWLLYQPGDLVISSKSSKLPLQAYRVVNMCGGRQLITKPPISYGNQLSFHQDKDRMSGISPFKIDCVLIDFDGETFGPVKKTIEISAFNDEREITELDVYPIDFSEHPSMLRDTLIKRGKHFATYRDFKHKRYSGLSLGDVKEEVSGTEVQLIHI